MGQAPRELVPSRSAIHFFGAELRHWRTLRGVSQNDLGRRTLDSGSTIGKVEKAVRLPTQRLARECDEALDTGGALQRLWPLVQQQLLNLPDSSWTAVNEEAGHESAWDEIGLHWSTDLPATVETVGNLWRADVQRRAVVVNAAWAAVAFAAPTRDWLLDRFAPEASRAIGRRVGAAEVEVLWSMCHTFTDLDHRLGGGHARSTLAHYLSNAVRPMLEGSYTDTTGRELLTAVARLCNLGGFMAFDCGLQGLAQRYYIQALRLAQVGGDRRLGAHILGDMSMQAHHLRDAKEALALAVAGQRTSQDCGSSATLARCCALEARAHALLGDPAACGQAMNRAERALEAAGGGEPAWISFFTPQQLAAEFMYAANDLGRRGDVQRFAPAVLASASGMQRRAALATVTLAASHLAADGDTDPCADIDQACGILRQALPVAATLSSPRTSQLLNSVRGRLQPYGTHPAIKALEDEMGTLVGATT